MNGPHMCGIAGEINSRGSARSDAVERMANVLASRGPDNAGLFSRRGIALSCRRLVITDASPRADQPMVDSELGLAGTFNGAIYNCAELRDALEGEGYRFFSRSDTEVVLKAYHRWGRNFAAHLEGMFAVAI